MNGKFEVGSGILHDMMAAYGKSELCAGIIALRSITNMRMFFEDCKKMFLLLAQNVAAGLENAVF